MSILAYALLIIGIPMYLGAFVGMATAPLAWSFPESKKQLILDVLKAVSGIVAMSAALLLFRLCGVHSSIAVLVVPFVWISAYHALFRQPLLSWTMWVVGLLIGWFVCFPWLRFP